MNNGIPIFFFAVMMLAVSCGSPKVVYRTEYRTEYKDRVVYDTTEVEIPTIIEKNVTRDTVSHLENKYARSDASVSDGFLSHSLETKPQKIQAPVEVHVIDTLIIEKEGVAQEVLVEKDLSRAQQIKLNLFWWLFSYVVVTFLWFFRKPLIGIIRQL